MILFRQWPVVDDSQARWFRRRLQEVLAELEANASRGDTLKSKN